MPFAKCRSNFDPSIFCLFFLSLPPNTIRNMSCVSGRNRGKKLVTSLNTRWLWWDIHTVHHIGILDLLRRQSITRSLLSSFSQHIRMLSGLDTAWVTNTNNGLYSYGHPHWRMVQLETAKLLELGCVLPATILPHFQM